MKNRQWSPFSKRLWVLLGVLSLAIVFIVLRNMKQPPAEAAQGDLGPKVSDGSPGNSQLAGQQQTPESGPAVTRSSRIRTEAPGNTQQSQFPQVQRILSDDSIPDLQAAVALFEIANNSGLAESERFEALAHGLNLNFPAFFALSQDPALPVPMAQRYFDELANRNQAPKEQIEGYLGLMNHSDEEIRKQAQHQLAFMLEDDAQELSPEELRQQAAERLVKLSATPVDQSEAVDGLGGK
ncbi:MAG: hypothetical protein ABI600_06440 [Luteolibacter sp.]